MYLLITETEEMLHPDLGMTKTVLAKIIKLVGLAACANKEMLNNNITNVCMGNGGQPIYNYFHGTAPFQNQHTGIQISGGTVHFSQPRRPTSP